MSDNPFTVEPIGSINYLQANHFRFWLQDLPDLRFYATSVDIPGIVVTEVIQGNPFSNIPHMGLGTQFTPLSVTFMLENAMRSYYSLYNWLQGATIFRSGEDVTNFIANRTANLPSVKPSMLDIEHTTGCLHILQPDTNAAVVEFVFYDMVITQLSSIKFETQQSHPLTAMATFACSYFDLNLLQT